MNPYKSLLRLGIPIILGQLGIISVNFADNIMVGHHEKAELAAASFANNLFGLAFILGLGFSYGLTPIVSAAIGRKRADESGLMLRHSLILNLAVSIVLVLAMTALLLRIDLFDLPDTVLAVITPYYVIQLVSLPIVMLFNGYKQYFDGVGRTQLSMWVMLVVNLINVFGNYLLIYGSMGLPELGLTGAGLASLASRVLSLATLMAIFHLAKRWREAHRSFISGSGGSRFYAKLFALGLPVAAQMGLEAASFTIAVVFVGFIGENALAAHQIICTITTLGFMIYYGIGAAATIQISFHRAQANTPACKKTATAAEHLALALAIALIALLLTTRSFAGYFFTPDPIVVHVVSIALIPVMVYQIGDAIQVIYANVLRGMEDVRFLAAFAAVAHIGIAPLLAYFFAFHLSPQGEASQLSAVWWAFPISLTLLGLMLKGRFLRIIKREVKPS